MKSATTALCAALVLAAGMGAGPAAAQGVLGGLLGGGGSDSGGSGNRGVVSGVTDTVGGVVNGLTGGGSGSNGSLADVRSGRAGTNSLVNAGLGSDADDPNNIADVNLGGNGGLLGNGNTNLRITGGNGQGGLLNNGGLLGTGLLDNDDDGGVLGSGILGSNLTVGLNLGGLDLDLSIPGIGGIIGGGNGGGGNGGGGNGNGNGNGNGGNGGRILVGSADGSFQVNCSVDDGRQVLQLASQAKLDPRAWRRAANVQVIPVKLCPQARAQVAQIFRASGKIQQLQGAAASDALITASLNRTRYDVNDVFAVQASGGRLMVYVY